MVLNKLTFANQIITKTMKKSLMFIVILMSLIIVIEGCKKEDNTPDLELGEINIKGEMMTLSAMGYVKDGSSPTEILKTIEDLLDDENLTTKGKWELAWGPGISENNENMLFVAKQKNSDNITEYAISVRGTNLHSAFDLFEDIDVFELVQFPHGEEGDMISYGALDGFNLLLSTKNMGSDNSTLEDFLHTINNTTITTPLYVTGHSQGGSLAPLISYWIKNQNDLKDKFIISTYIFAGPSVVNDSFRNNFIKLFPHDSLFFSYVNSLDIMPYYWSDLLAINSKNIPVHVPLKYRNHNDSSNTKLQEKGIKYYNLAAADTIGNIPIEQTHFPDPHPGDTTLYYLYWVEKEHNYNNYLTLLGAEPIK